MKKIKNNFHPALLNYIIKFSTEFEYLSKNGRDRTESNFLRMFGRFATDESVNNGNGFNPDLHRDGSVRDGAGHNQGVAGDGIPAYATNYHSLEISTSPLNGTTFKDMAKELEGLIYKLKESSGDIYPTVYGSNHIHCSILYDENGSILEGINTTQLTNAIALMVKGFYPAIRILGALTPETMVRNTNCWSNDYSYTVNDRLWAWDENTNFNVDAIGGMDNQRKSVLRTSLQDRKGGDVFHIEYRGSDGCHSPILLALQMSVIKAIVMYCANCLKFNVKPYVDQSLINKSYDATRKLKNGVYDEVAIQEVGHELISRIAPFLKLMDSTEVIDILYRFYEKPAFLILRENGKANAWDKVERYLLGRNRAKDEKKRQLIIEAIVSCRIPKAKDLNGFKQNLADNLGLTKQEINSLYVMLNREGVNLQFEEGRLCVY